MIRGLDFGHAQNVFIQSGTRILQNYKSISKTAGLNTKIKLQKSNQYNLVDTNDFLKFDVNEHKILYDKRI